MRNLIELTINDIITLLSSKEAFYKELNSIFAEHNLKFAWTLGNPSFRYFWEHALLTAIQRFLRSLGSCPGTNNVSYPSTDLFLASIHVDLWEPVFWTCFSLFVKASSILPPSGRTISQGYIQVRP